LNICIFCCCCCQVARTRYCFLHNNA
jgi:hypothetical protein